MAEWLNTTKVPGTDLTYQQYMESFKHRIPAQEFKKLKQETLDIASRIAYRKKQGEMLDLKMEYQECVNRFARLGRTLGNDWANLLISGLMWLSGKGKEDVYNALGQQYQVGDDYISPPTP